VQVALDWTDGSGTYSIGGLPAGTYCLRATLAPKDPYILTQNPRTITLGANEKLLGVNFFTPPDPP
jgi:hypothetical protein